MATRSEQKPTEEDWEQRRTDFLNDPRGGFLRLFESLNRKVAMIVAPGRRTWEDVSATDQFQQAFDYVTERLLSLDGFRNVFERHRYSGSRLALWQFMDNRVSLLLAEWNSKRSEEPSAVIQSDENIEQQSNHGPSEESQPRHSYDALMERIMQLPQPQAAALLLLLWPIPSFPEAWREKLLPLILSESEKNGLSRKEAKRRLDEVFVMTKPMISTEVVEREVRRGLHHGKMGLFDRKKRYHSRELLDLSTRGEYSPESGVEHELRCDCYRAVARDAEKDVLLQFPPEDIYEELESGLRYLKNRPLWHRRRFSYCCYKQKYHRRCWLNVLLELLAQKSVDGPMSYSDISRILNCPENTAASNLSRARQKLLAKSGSGDEEDLSPMNQVDVEEARSRWKAELDPERLKASVCEDLKPQIIQHFSKSGS